MGRSELPVDPAQGPLQRFAADLQSLRRASGEPTYRAMSNKSGVSSSTLSQAAKGQRLPTLQTTLAFVRACGGDGAAEKEWRERWEQVREEMARPAPAAEAPPEPAPEVSPSEPPTPRRPPRGVTLAAGMAVVLVIGLLAGFFLFSGPSGESSPRPSSTEAPPTPAPTAHPIKDGQDPYVQGCGRDQRPMERQPIYRADGTRYGWVVLFVSPSCSAAWGYVYGPNSPGWRVSISAHRMDDDVEARSSFKGKARPNSWGNALSTENGCVRAEAWVDKGPRGITSCWRQNGLLVRQKTG